MKEELTFGKCLEDLLAIREWSCARLAREMFINESYVRKWVRGERVPALKSEYIPKIAELLTTRLNRSVQDSLSSYCSAGTMVISDLSEALKQRLSTAQIASLAMAPEERMNPERVTDFLRSVTQRKEIPGTGDQVRKPFKPITHKGTLIKGTRQVTNTIITMLKRASQEEGTGRKIHLTSHGECDILPPGATPEWALAVKAVLEKGWNVTHLIRLNNNLSRSFSLAEQIIQFQGYLGTYTPLYYQRYGTSTAELEFVVVPNVGSLQVITTRDELPETAFYYSQPEAIAAWEKYLTEISTDTLPLIAVSSEEEYLDCVVQIDQKLGDRLIAKTALDIITFPVALFDEYIRNCVHDEQEIEKIMAGVRARIQAFLDQIGRYKFLNICPMSVIENLVATGEVGDTCSMYRPAAEKIVSRLDYLIHLLRNNDNFQLALLNEAQVNQIMPISWMVKGNYGAFFYIKKPLDNSLMWLTIREPTLIEAFRDCYTVLWDKIPPRFRDKAFVIDWLEEQKAWFIKTKCPDYHTPSF